MRGKLKTCQRGGRSHAGEGIARKVTLAPTRIGVCSCVFYSSLSVPLAMARASRVGGQNVDATVASMPLLGSQCPRFQKRVTYAGAFLGRTTARAAEERDVRLNRIVTPDS
jgi:hypothetical protein